MDKHRWLLLICALLWLSAGALWLLGDHPYVAALHFFLAAFFSARAATAGRRARR